MKIEYQIGVDVLGFPIYCQHEVFRGITPASYTTKEKGWVRVFQSIIKQF